MTTAPFTPTAHRPGPRAWLLLVTTELRCVVRDTAGLLIPVGLPVLFLTMYGLGGGGEAGSGDDRGTFLELFGIPLAAVMVLSLVGVVNMPSFLATYRRTGVLRRLAVTPVEPAHVLGAQVVVSVLQSAVGIGLAVVVATAGFGAEVSGSVPLVLATLLLVAAAMYGLGLVVAAVAPTPNSAVALGLVGFFAMGATGGMFGPVQTLPSLMGDIGRWLPFGAGMEAVQAALIGESMPVEGLLALAAAAVVGLLVGLLTFRWDS